MDLKLINVAKFKQMKTKFKVLPIVVLGGLLAFSSCSDDNNDPDPTPNPVEEGSKDALIMTMSPKPNTNQDGSSYMQVIDASKKAQYDNTNALQISYGSMPSVIQKDIFYLPFLGKNSIIKYQEKSGKIEEVAKLPIQADASPAQIAIVNKDKAYISLFGKGKLLVVNPETMKLIKEIPLYSYGKGDENPNPGVMIIRDGKLFVGLGQMVGGLYTFNEDSPSSDILVLDTNTDEPIKMITENTSRIASCGRPANQGDVFMDENKDIYMVCLGAFGQGSYPKHHAGILRIKNGTTEFDTSYQLNLDDAIIEGEEQENISFLLFSQYYKGGKLYALALLDGEAGRVIPIEIDLITKKVKRVKEVEDSNMFGSVSLYKNKIVWGISNTKSRGFFMYDPNTGKITEKEAFIKTNGHPSLFRELRK